MGNYDQYKEQVLMYSQLMLARGYTVGTGGNISVLVEGEEKVAVTPSGRDYMDLTVDDICVVNFDLSTVEGSYQPSIETGMHITVYQNRADVNAVIHTHQVYASVFALTGQPLPPLFDEVVMNIGPIVDVIPYGLSGSAELAANVASKLGNRCACYLLQNHGALCLGTSLEKAFRNVELLEKTAHVYSYALSTGQKPLQLPENIVTMLTGVMHYKQDQEIERKKSLKA
ncbi:MAG: class II aldolase/adducin family protein [Chitinophagales bacterium]